MALHQGFEWRNQFCGASRLRLAQSVDGWSGQSKDLDGRGRHELRDGKGGSVKSIGTSRLGAKGARGNEAHNKVNYHQNRKDTCLSVHDSYGELSRMEVMSALESRAERQPCWVVVPPPPYSVPPYE